MAAEKARVFDACAVIAWLLDEEGADVVDDILTDPSNRCLISPVNACEVYYDLRRRNQVENAESLDSILAAGGFEIAGSTPPTTWKEAGRLKADLRRISLADCFAIALAREENGDLITSDHHPATVYQAPGTNQSARINPRRRHRLARPVLCTTIADRANRHAL